MLDPAELREQARWYSAAAKNTSDAKLKKKMAVRAQELLQLAEALSRLAGGMPKDAASGQGSNSDPHPA